jgi:serine/threonine-protein kinase HipA
VVTAAVLGRVGLSRRNVNLRTTTMTGTCSLDLLEAASGFFALTLAQARANIKELAAVTATWRDTAKAVGARLAEISRMASAFEHDDLKRALVL